LNKLQEGSKKRNC